VGEASEATQFSSVDMVSEKWSLEEATILYLYAMLEAVKLPASVAHLNACLSNVDAYALPHSLLVCLGQKKKLMKMEEAAQRFGFIN
jgi:hypothetical protein